MPLTKTWKLERKKQSIVHEHKLAFKHVEFENDGGMSEWKCLDISWKSAIGFRQQC